MSVIKARGELLDALYVGITPTHADIANFVEEVNDFLTVINDYDEWDASREVVVDGGDEGLSVDLYPAISVAKLRKVLGYTS